jgi:hypothetical protein
MNQGISDPVIDWPNWPKSFGHHTATAQNIVREFPLVNDQQSISLQWFMQVGPQGFEPWTKGL